MRKSPYLLLILILIFLTEVTDALLEQYRKEDDILVRIEDETTPNRPLPSIASMIYPERITKGEIVYLNIEVNNSGAYSPEANVILSFSHGMEIVNYSGFPTIYYPGEEILHRDGYPIEAEYTVVNWTTEFGEGESKLFSINFTVTEMDEQWFKVRLLFYGEGGKWGGMHIYPTSETSNSTDQQGWPVIEGKISVVRAEEPNILLSTLCEEISEDGIDIKLTFRNIGEKTLMDPAYYWDGRILKNDWNLAPGASKSFFVRLSNYLNGTITKTARVTGCYGKPCSSHYYSKEFTITFSITDNTLTSKISEELNLGISNYTSYKQAEYEQPAIKTKTPESLEVETSEPYQEERSIIQLILDTMTNFFKLIFG